MGDAGFRQQNRLLCGGLHVLSLSSAAQREKETQREKEEGPVIPLNVVAGRHN